MDTLKQLEQHITCCVCLEIYREPQVLKCLHTFCQQCLDQLALKSKIQCPECRECTVMEEVKADFKTLSLIEMHKKSIAESTEAKQKCSKKCDLCSDENKVIRYQCIDCDQFMCGDCYKAHKGSKISKDHIIISVEEAISKLQKELGKTVDELQSDKEAIHKYSSETEVAVERILIMKEQQKACVEKQKQEYIQQIEDYHETLKSDIDYMNNEITAWLKGNENTCRETEGIIDQRIRFLTDTMSSTDISHLADMVSSMGGDNLREDIKKFRSTLQASYLKAGSPVSVKKGEALNLESLTKVQKNDKPWEVIPAEVKPKGKLSKTGTNHYQIVKSVPLMGVGQPMRMILVNGEMWFATYNKGLVVYNEIQNTLKIIQHEDMKAVCSMAHTDIGDIAVACAERNGLLRLDCNGSYVGRITTGNFSDVTYYNQHIYALDYERCTMLMFKYHTEINKWFCEGKFHLQWSYGHYCDRIFVNDSGTYVSSYNKNCMFVYNHQGHLTRRIGTEGSEGIYPGIFEGALLCEADVSGNVLAIDRINHSIQIYQNVQNQWKVLALSSLQNLCPIDMVIDEEGQYLWIITNEGYLMKYGLMAQ